MGDQPPGKHVPSRVPLPGGPVDATARVNAHRGVNDGPTSGGPVTVGVNPDPPAQPLISENDALTSGTPAASTEPTSFPPYGGNY
jgi:hypothetical protein